MKMSDINKLIKKLKKLVRTRATDLQYKRKYIPKTETTSRPLGVPSLEWRVYLHMYNNCITMWRMVTERGNQHGYIPGKGVLSA